MQLNKTPVYNHSFRATGITACLVNPEGRVELALLQNLISSVLVSEVRVYVRH